jgi:hypothetical protein
MITFICLLQNQENISVLVGILTEKANFFDYATLVQFLGLCFVVFPGKFPVFCSFADKLSDDWNRHPY